MIDITSDFHKYFNKVVRTENNVEYLIERNIEEGILYKQVSGYYLLSFINYLIPIQYILLKNHSDSKRWKKLINEENSLMYKDSYSRIILRHLQEDSVFLGKTSNYYWLFWLNSDTNYVNCSIGKLSKYKFTEYEIRDLLLSNYKHNSIKFKEIKLSHTVFDKIIW